MFIPKLTLTYMHAYFHWVTPLRSPCSWPQVKGLLAPIARGEGCCGQVTDQMKAKAQELIDRSDGVSVRAQLEVDTSSVFDEIVPAHPCVPNVAGLEAVHPSIHPSVRPSVRPRTRG